MNPGSLLYHLERGTLWPTRAPGAVPDAAYASALAVRAQRIARGEPPRGFKLGFTLRALAHCVTTLLACPGAPDLHPGDVVTTGTWSDAWPLHPGGHWQASFSLPGFQLAIHTSN